MKPWLSIVGIGEDGVAGLGEAARERIAQAEVLIGGVRHLALVPRRRERRIVWGSLHADFDRIAALRGKRVCILASGDPMWFGIGATLARRFDAREMTAIPHAGAFSLAAARLGWALHETACLSAHGRPLAVVIPHLHPGAKLLVLAEDGSTAGKIVALLRAHGCGGSAVTVLERLGGPRERICAARGRHDALAVVAVEVVAGRGATPARIPGLADEAFAHDGQITKHEARAAALAALAPWPGALLWDIGAGAGSVAIEWMRAGGRAIAIEREAKRRDFIAANAARLGTPALEIVAGTAPAALKGLALPDAIFVGGGTSDAKLLTAAWRALPKGGRLVAHAVTAEGEAALLAFHALHGGELTRIAVARLAPVGRFSRWHPEAPVTQLKAIKQ